MKICQRIFDYMGQDKTKLRALAQTLGTASSTVSSWKLRHTDPPARYIVPIAEFLGVSPLWLLTGIENREQIQSQAEPPYLKTTSPQHGSSSVGANAPINNAYRELTTLYSSLDRPGQIIMLAAGYQQQLRVEASSNVKNEITPPETLVLFSLFFHPFYISPHSKNGTKKLYALYMRHTVFHLYFIFVTLLHTPLQP